MNIDQIDGQLTDAHMRMAQVFRERMEFLIAVMFLLVLAVAFLATLRGWWKHRNSETSRG